MLKSRILTVQACRGIMNYSYDDFLMANVHYCLPFGARVFALRGSFGIQVFSVCDAKLHKLAHKC